MRQNLIDEISSLEINEIFSFENVAIIDKIFKGAL